MDVVEEVHDSVTVVHSSDELGIVLVFVPSSEDLGGGGSVSVKSAVIMEPVYVGRMGTKKVLVGRVRVNEAVIMDMGPLLAPGFVDTAELGTTTGPTPLWDPSMSEKMDRSAFPSDEADLADLDSFDNTDESKESEAEGRGDTRGELTTALSVIVNVCTTVVEPDSNGTVTVAVTVLGVRDATGWDDTGWDETGLGVAVA